MPAKSNQHKMITILNLQNSVLNHFLSEMRDENIQVDRMRFRQNLIRIGEIMAYEISKTLNYKSVDVKTPLGISTIQLIDQQLVIATILRAGLPLQQGMLSVFDKADSAFVSAYRKTKKNGSFEIKVEYVASPDLTDKVLILADPMLATGQSIVLACQELLEKGIYKSLHIAAIIGSKVGVEYVRRHLPDAHIWLCALDEELTTRAYIVPGLGDAGDLAYGEK